jgi:tetratricopeptide (TPR) repeat protein
LNDGQIDAALEQYKVIADSNPEDAQTYLRMAEIYRSHGQYDLALDNLKKAESMVQDSMEVPYNIAAVYQAQGRYDEAAKKFCRSWSRKPTNPTAATRQSEKNNRAVFLRALGYGLSRQGERSACGRDIPKDVALGDDNAERGYQQTSSTLIGKAKQWQKATDVAKEATQKVARRSRPEDGLCRFATR